jgi:hypothetical protein
LLMECWMEKMFCRYTRRKTRRSKNRKIPKRCPPPPRRCGERERKCVFQRYLEVVLSLPSGCLRRAHLYTVDSVARGNILFAAEDFHHGYCKSCGPSRRGICRCCSPPLQRRATRANRFNVESCYFFSAISIEARVISQSNFMVQLVPGASKEIVKFSSGAESFDTFISMRAKSNFSPG